MNKMFDLENIDDVTNGCKANLKLNNLKGDTKKLFDLFEKKNILSIDEILVALNRDHKLEKKRSWVSNTLYNLAQKELVKKVIGEQGVYEKV